MSKWKEWENNFNTEIATKNVCITKQQKLAPKNSFLLSLVEINSIIPWHFHSFSNYKWTNLIQCSFRYNISNTWNIVVNSLVTYLLQRKSGETYHKLYKILKKYICDYVNLGLLRQENADLWWIPITNARWSLSSLLMNASYAWLYISGQNSRSIFCYIGEGHSVVHHIYVLS